MFTDQTQTCHPSHPVIMCRKKNNKRSSDLRGLPHSCQSCRDDAHGVGFKKKEKVVREQRGSDWQTEAFHRKELVSSRRGLGGGGRWEGEVVVAAALGVQGTFCNSSFGSGRVAFSQGNASEKVTKTQESESA